MKKIILIVLVNLFLSGCVALETRLQTNLYEIDILEIQNANKLVESTKDKETLDISSPRVNIGMTTGEVKAIVGKPTKTVKNNDIVVLYYYLKGFRCFGTIWPAIIPVGRQRYELIFKQDRLEKILLKTDVYL